MRYLLTGAFLLLVSLPSLAQADCALTVADLPEIHGLRLGTSRREVARVYSLTATGVRANSDAARDVQGLEGMWFDFFQDSLSVIEFDYKAGMPWTNVRQFAAHLGFSVKLPIDAWVFIDRTEAKMQCRGFEVSISYVRNTFALMDTFAKAAARRNASMKQPIRIRGQ